MWMIRFVRTNRTGLVILRLGGIDQKKNGTE